MAVLMLFDMPNGYCVIDGWVWEGVRTALISNTNLAAK